MTDETEELEEGPNAISEGRVITPERQRAVKRDVEEQDDSMGEHNKARITDMIQPMDSVVDPVEATIIASAIFNADITEVYCPVWVAAVAAKYGLVPGTAQIHV